MLAVFSFIEEMEVRWIQSVAFHFPFIDTV